jgi:hypothetical protein
MLDVHTINGRVRRVRAMAGALLIAAYVLAPFLHVASQAHPAGTPVCSTCPDGAAFNTARDGHNDHHDAATCRLCQFIHGASGITLGAHSPTTAAPAPSVAAIRPVVLLVPSGPDVHVIGPRAPPC